MVKSDSQFRHAKERVQTHCTTRTHTQAHAREIVPSAMVNHAFHRVPNNSGIETVTVTLKAEGLGPPAAIRIRRALKCLLRTFGLRCELISTSTDLKSEVNYHNILLLNDLHHDISDGATPVLQGVQSDGEK